MSCFIVALWALLELSDAARPHFVEPNKEEEHRRRSGALLLLVFICAVLLAIRYVSGLQRYYGLKLAKEQSIIEKALHATEELAFPMVLLKVDIFKRFGKFMAFEEVLNESFWLHTMQEIDDFLSKDIVGKRGKKNKVIFMSHQWTAFQEPDHTGQQYQAMVVAVNTVIARNAWDEEDTYVWVDYSCIPQRHRPSQTAAINSLTVYAAKVSAFIVVAPRVPHKDLEGVFCDEESYKRRAWCRAEQLSHLLAQAGDNMFLSNAGGFVCLGHDEEWLSQSVEVFKGELTCCRRHHQDMDKCDMERLVVPMLGLWAQLCRTVKHIVEEDDEEEKRPFVDLKEIHKHVSQRIKEIFPESFSFTCENRSEERTLFGKLVEGLQERLDQEETVQPEEKKTNWAKLRIARKLAQLPAGGGRRLSAALRASTELPPGGGTRLSAALAAMKAEQGR